MLNDKYYLFRNELPLVDYIQTIGNFNPGYIYSGLYCAGYFDPWNIDSDELDEAAKLSSVSSTRESLSNSTGNTTTYNFIFRPPTGILNSCKPLLPKSEMIITFDRAISDIALINKPDATANDLTGKMLTLKNVNLKATYLTSPYIRNHFDTITSGDISYRYDECAVYHKNLPQGDASIRLSNVIGGNTPTYLFAGIIESTALNGDITKSSTAFKRHKVIEFDLTLNGYSCHGFPLVSENNSPLLVYDKFLRTTNRSFQNKCAQQLLPADFQQFHYLYTHKFQGEPSETGWIGINLKLESAYDENFTLG